MAYKIHIDGFIGDSGLMGGDCFTLKDLNRALDAMPSNTKEIDVIINSGGGYITEGFAIHDRLANVEEKVNTKVLGLCGSIATIIAQAPKSQGLGGTRSGHQNSDYFIHNPSWSPQSPDPIEADELQRIAEDLMANQDKLANFYSSITGGEVTMFADKMKEAKSLTMEEAKELGLIDSIIKTNIQAATIYKFAAHVTKPINIMTQFETKLKEMFGAFRNEITAIVKPATKNETKKTSEGVDIWYEGELAVGTKIYTDEAMTVPAPDGVHTVGDTVFTIAAGEVTEVKDVPMDKTELEIANETIAALKAELETAKGSVTASVETAVASAKAELATEFENKFTAFKGKFFTGEKLNPEIIQIMKSEGEPAEEKLSPFEVYAKQVREKNNQ